MIIHDLIAENYSTVLIIICMVTFLLSNVNFERRVMKNFMVAIMMVVVLTIVDNVESWTATFDHPTMLRIVMSAIGYTVRPISVLCILLIIIRDKAHKKTMLVMPAVINGLIAFSAVFTDIAYSYSETNEFVRGPLGISAYVTSAIYLIVLVVVTFAYRKERNHYESFVVITIVVVNVMSTVFEVLGFSGFINNTMALSITFYYLYFHTQSVKKDPLTQALNRRCMYLDVERNYAHLSAVISIDLNDLKKLNDGQGHSAGDKALCVLTECVQKHLVRGCSLYRTGGDEFTVLCVKQDMNTLKKMITKIREEVAKTPYSCAIGLVSTERCTNFDEVAAKADKAMYEDKIRIKGSAR